MKQELKEKHERNTHNSESFSKIKQLEAEVMMLRAKANELKSVKVNNDDFSSQYSDEIKKLEQTFESRLKTHQTTLEIELNNKKNLLKTQYLNKRLEYETKLKKNLVNSDQPSESGSLLRDKKNLIMSNHKARIENYKETLISHYEKQAEVEKENYFNEANKELSQLKENYDMMQSVYENQKLIYATEQNVIYASNMLLKLKNIFENKNSVFKNLIDYSYYLVRKKVNEMENNKELALLSNKDIIINKIAESLILIIYENIYEFLITDLNGDKELVTSCLDELTSKLESIIANFSFEKKVQLSMLICNPNFNF